MRLIITTTYLFCILFIQQTYAQSFYYNTQQYGLKSTLLSGAVTAGNEDLSMVYYNPAALKYTKNQSADVSLIMPTISSHSFNDYFGEGTNTNSTSFSLTPNLITYRFSFIKKMTVVLCLLEKDSWDDSFKYQSTSKQGNFFELQHFRYDFKGSERWFGVGTTYPLSPRLSVGFSQFFSILSTDYRYSIGRHTIDSGSEYLLNNVFHLQYHRLGAMISKVGLTYEVNHHRFGFTFTTPYYVSFSQGGSYEEELTYLENENIIAATHINYDISPTIKNTLKMEVGYAHFFNDSTEVWFSGAYQSRINNYTMAPLVATFSGDSISLTRERKGVFNFGIGINRKINKKIDGLLGFRTNFSSFRRSPPVDNARKIYAIQGDKYHISGGVNIKHKGNQLTLGLDIGFSFNKNASLLGDFPHINSLDTHSAPYTHTSFTFLVTYAFLLDSLKELAD